MVFCIWLMRFKSLCNSFALDPCRSQGLESAFGQLKATGTQIC